MKVHYINILLFSLPLNILVTLCHVNAHKKPSITTPHTPKIPTTRLLCECEFYATANYDSDPQMKEVMDNFNKQTQQRFYEYEERMKTTRQKCKDQCDRESQKIILKDKLEKKLMDKFSTLDTDIQSDAIPTCICEKSMADKVEKGCLRCGGILGSAVPELTLLGGISTHALTTAATSAAIEAGMRKVIFHLKDFVKGFTGNTVDLSSIVTSSNFNCPTALLEAAQKKVSTSCFVKPGIKTTLCARLESSGAITFKGYAEYGMEAYNATYTSQTTAISSFNTAMIASIIAIVVIVLIMVIIYLILRYRRKKKMKKKLQYIKLLEE